MIEAIYFYGSEKLDQAYQIRETVFIQEQGVPETIEKDGLDKTSLHVLLSIDGKPVATGRLEENKGYFKIGRVAVLKAYRGHHYGDAVMKMLIDKAFAMGAGEVIIHSQCHANGFYEKMGFIKEGPVFQEAGIDHQKMILKKGQLKKSCQC